MLLGLLVDNFEVVVPDVDESMQRPYGPALDEVALRKNAAVDGDVVLSADTIGLLDGTLLQKPHSKAAAQVMWHHMNGHSHEVRTAICVNGNVTSVSTKVHMRVPASVARQYLEDGKWEGKAGGYGIQDPELAPHITIEGSWSNVVGLPLEATRSLLEAAGIACHPMTDQQAMDQNLF